uniref:DEAD-box ATP-dependent RNA helicase 40-like n=1 Tax=Rhizophora mucronata TaxID=61149 RepID=A0A2P2K945_RHIMU
MATVGPSSASTGPRYAPEDPSLPKPWLGLIDGSTGLLYYWNPETNITQYEKPASLPPPLPPGPPPTASTPKLAQLPVANSVQPNGLVAQATQQITQAMLQQGQQVSQSPLQHGQAMAQYQASSVAQVSNLQGAQQQGSQLGQTMQQPGQLRPQMMQHPGQQMLSYIGQQMPQQGGQQLAQHPGQPIQQQAIQQMPPHQSMQMPPPHGQQYIYQQTHYMAYQQSILQHGQQNSQQQNQLSAQGLQFPNQNEYKAGPPKREEGDFEQANQTGSSPAHFQQAGASSLHNLPAGSTPVSAGMHAGQAQQFGGSAPNMKQPSSVVQLQSDIGHQQHGSRLPNQMGASAMHSQQSTAPPVGLNIGYERNVHGMGGSDYYFSPKLEGPAMTPSQPNLAAIPMARNQQESRMGGVPFKDVTPGYASGFNSAGHSMNNMYSHAPAGPPFLNNAFVRPPFTGTSDISNLSPAEVYCQEHEVTATVCYLIHSSTIMPVCHSKWC